MIYLIVFFVSLIFLKLGFNKKFSRDIRKNFIIISLILPCLLAGARGLSVGTDTNGYIYDLFIKSQKIDNIFKFFEIADNLYLIKDYAYLIITFFIGKLSITWNFQLLLFVFEILIIFPLYFSLKKMSIKDSDIIFGFFIILFTFYNLSLNMVRQAIAISFFVSSISFFVKNDGKKSKILSLIMYLIAIEFHNTAFFMFPIFIVYKIMNSKKYSNRKKFFLSLSISVVSILMLIFYKYILMFIGKSGIYPKALIYLNKFSIEKLNFSVLGTFNNILLFYLIIKNKKYYIRNKINYYFGYVLASLNLIFGFLGIFILYADRISYYLFYLLIVNYISVLSTIQKKQFHRTIIIIFTFLFYWIWTILINNSSQTLPYIFYK